MLSTTISASLKVLLEGVVRDTEAEFSREENALVSMFIMRNSLHSSAFSQSLDEAAATVMKQAAEKLVEETVIAHEAEPATDSSARAAQLSEALSASLAEAFAVLKEAKHHRLKSIQGVSPGSALEGCYASVSARALARLQMRVTAVENRRSTTITVNGPVGALQTGANATAAVQQTIYLPNSKDALAALERIENVVKTTPSVSSTAEVLEMLQDLKDQTLREKPNPIKISALIGGPGSFVQTIPTIAPAWETVVGWAAVARDAVSARRGS